MPLQQTSGAASYDAFGGGVPVAAKYIEDFFQTWLRTGTGSSVTVPTGLNGAVNETMVWTKSRSAATNHKLTDNVRGVTKALSSNTTGAEVTDSQGLTAFSSTGYTIGTNTDYNNSGATYVDWQWVSTPKFFDVVTWSGNSVSGRQIPHNLGSVPGCIIVKVTSVSGSWFVWHRSMGGNNFYMTLNSPDPRTNGGAPYWNNTGPTDTVFTVGNDSDINQTGRTYVAYLFAHNAGGFGLTGTDNVISCGSFTAFGGANDINLGFETQFILLKKSNAADDWYIYDTMRGMPVGNSGAPALEPNLSVAEGNQLSVWPTATGFATNDLTGTYIYIAIRRGPMKVPTTGTSVFGLSARTGTSANATVTGSAGVTDLAIIKNRGSTPVWAWASRLTGTGYLSSNATTAEVAAGTTILQANPWDVMDGVKVGTSSPITNDTGRTYINYLLDRAPGFFDQVCTTLAGVSGNDRVAHNLGVPPELIIMKTRATVSNWYSYNAPQGRNFWLEPNTTNASTNDANSWGTSNPTSTDFGVASNFFYGTSVTVVCYLFASCPGVSKVGSYTGTGTTQTINCGFTAGSRFVMIKRADSTGDWYVWDSARGIVAGNDPRLSLNSTAAEVTTDDSVDTDSTGFVVNQLAATNVNVNGGTYIFLAIA